MMWDPLRWTRFERTVRRVLIGDRVRNPLDVVTRRAVVDQTEVDRARKLSFDIDTALLARGLQRDKLGWVVPTPGRRTCPSE